jgi:hypothetical protein
MKNGRLLGKQPHQTRYNRTRLDTTATYDQIKKTEHRPPNAARIGKYSHSQSAEDLDGLRSGESEDDRLLCYRHESCILLFHDKVDPAFADRAAHFTLTSMSIPISL